MSAARVRARRSLAAAGRATSAACARCLILARALAIAAACALARPAGAQDFACAGPPLAGPAPARLLEAALPAAAPGLAIAATQVRWHDLAELGTRAIAAAFGAGSLRAALGVSQTGDDTVGWSAAGLGAGWGASTGGAGVRAVARRDRTSPFALDAASDAWGVEAGAGGWIALDHAWRAWASAPSLWRDGEAPPLARALAGGVSWQAADARAWITLATAPAWAGGAGAGLGGGVALRFGPAWLWAAGRDHPARPALGLELAARGARVTAEAESHPVLGTTTRLAIAFERSAAP